VWDCTEGLITKETVDQLRLFVLNKYQSEWSHNKVLSFAKAFLKFLTKVRLDTRYHAFELFLERPRAIKVRNNVTSRIITKEDIENVLAHIINAERGELISSYRAQHYTAFVLFGAFTGQRSLATIAKLTIDSSEKRYSPTSNVLRCNLHRTRLRCSTTCHYIRR
jgi:hypothetical protein